MDKKDIIILIIVLILVACGVYFFATPGASQNQQNNQPDLGQQTPADYDTKKVNVEILKEGAGEPAKSGDKVTVNYVGTLQDGTKFDSSIDRGTPFVFTLGQNSVIQGWELGVLGMKVGEKRKLTIPPELGYGSRGAGGAIPPNATLVFEIDMLGINQ